MGGSNAWAEDEYTSVYSRTLAQWTDADLTDWHASNGVAINATNGIGIKANQTATYLNKSFSIESQSKIKYEVEWAFGTATGRTNNYNYIDFGSIRIAVNSSYNVYLSSDGGSNWNATTLGYYYNQTKHASISMIVNTANGRVESFSFDGTDRTSLLSSAVISNANVVKTGFIRGASVSWELDNFIKSIAVTESKQTVSTADYEINYIFEENVIKTDNGNTAVGETVNAESPITIGGQKYYATSGTSMTIDADAANNVLNVDLRKAYDYNYSVVSSTGTNLASGVCIEDENVTVAIPRYINVSGTLFETSKGGDWFHRTYRISQNNQVETITYNATGISNVVCYAEAEELPGATSGNGNSTRTSMGLTGYGNNLPVTNLAPGKYKIYMHAANGNSAVRNVVFKNGETSVVEFVIAGSNNNQDFVSAEFMIEADAAITLTSDGSNASGVDFFYIVKTGFLPIAGEDATVAIVNPTIDGSTGWTCERPNGGNGPLLNNVSFEFWCDNNTDPTVRENGSFDYYQTLNNLPNGYYTISAEMYNSLNGETGAVFNESCGVYGTSSVDNAMAYVTVEGNTLNRYTTNPILVTDGTLRIGVKSDKRMGARWFVADNFQLTYVCSTGASCSRATATGKYGTLCLPYAFDATGAKLYTITAVNEGVVELTEAASSTEGVAGKPYIYFATADAQTFTQKSVTVASPVADEYLVGSFVAARVEAGNYVLQTQNGRQGFYKVSAETSINGGAFKCYLKGEKVGNSRSAIFFDGDETAIDALNALTSGNAQIFDLNGRKLNKLQKGVNIVNGVKILVK